MSAAIVDTLAVIHFPAERSCGLVGADIWRQTRRAGGLSRNRARSLARPENGVSDGPVGISASPLRRPGSRAVFRVSSRKVTSITARRRAKSPLDTLWEPTLSW